MFIFTKKVVNLKIIKKKLRILYNKLSWHKDFFLLSAPYNRKSLFKVNTKDLQNVLILAPHSDDEWIGCSQIIKKSKKCTVYYFNFLGNNYNKDNEQIRLKEIENLCKIFKLNLVVSSSYDDYSDLKNLIYDNNFSHVFLPFPIDWHYEHLKVNLIFREVLNEKYNYKFKKLHYNISMALPCQNKILYSPLSKQELREKRNVFLKNYLSQHGTSIYRMNLQCRLNAKNTNHKALETYSSLDWNTWEKLLDFSEKNYHTKYKPLVHILDKIQKIRSQTNVIFHEFIQEEEKNKMLSSSI